ncbi:MAG: hypothetical protein J0L87_03090 [Bacteroidetes bacterium]|nr:hypothetical protein [Bacteroidota bacterium]
MEAKIDKLYYEFWNEHYPEVGGVENVGHLQWKFKLFPYVSDLYSGESQFIEWVKEDEAMFGNSIFCKVLVGREADALANRFSLFRDSGVEVDRVRTEDMNEVFYFVAYIYTLERSKVYQEANLRNLKKSLGL